MAKTNLVQKPDYQMLAFGQYGSRKIGAAGSGTAGETYKAIQALENTVITLTQERGDTTLNLTLLAGATVYGLFQSVSVASGTVLAYIG